LHCESSSTRVNKAFHARSSERSTYTQDGNRRLRSA